MTRRARNKGKGKGVHIGTSGWHYDHWEGAFYPAGLPKKRRLAHYAEHFKTVEINNSFYKLPGRDTLHTWRETVPSGFCFAFKASRYITHMKKLKHSPEALVNMFETAATLGDKLGPVLFQLPPRWGLNLERFRDFLALLPADYRYAFEFRDASWYDNRVYETLERHNAAFCIYHLAGHLSPKHVTADFVYVRLHGPEGAYEGKYTKEALTEWAKEIHFWKDLGKDIFCYFDNDQAGFAAANALELKEIMDN